MAANHLKVSAGFDILNRCMAPYICREFVIQYGEDWWKKGVIDTLFDDQKKDLPKEGSPTKLAKSLDIARCLLLMDVRFNEVFKKKLPRDCKNWVMELKGTRNKWAHRGFDDMTDSDTWRALDTMSRLCEQISPEGAAEINKLLREVKYGSEAGSMDITENVPMEAKKRTKKLKETMPVSNLPSWRDVMEPHQDVARGEYKNAEFAADLAQVSAGQGSAEYRDPVEFFGRTYVTEGMKGLLVESLERLQGKGGEPVIQLKTAFGGGKTHSMLALYHLLHSSSLMKDIPNVQPVLKEAGVTNVPETHVAAIVGTYLNPAKQCRPNNMPGITVNTLWGEIAYRLALSKNDPAVYDFIKDADKKGVAPGSQALKEMFDYCGTCLILMDELVAYAKKLYGAEKLPAGTFDNFITFIQEITEAARASKSSLVVASIPESNNEIGGEAGQIALDAIEHTFGRMEAVWKPVTAREGFEVVRRRLFLNCKDEAARDVVCNAFSKMYQENPSDFPVEARELEYRDRMISSYPIHPEVFDRLYEDWTTIENFQRTRSVLRLMAAVIHELWMDQDGSPMIMPGSFPLDVPPVKNELTRYLEDSWNGVVDSEVDGKQSLPYKTDKDNSRYGNLLACRRTARTVMLGSAPDVSEQSARGIETSHIRLGTVQPQENIAVFNDALNTLRNSASYLYSDSGNNRYWFDTRPTLRKVVEDRAQQLSDGEAYQEIERRLKQLRKVSPFAGIHVCPTSSMDVPDEQELRLVILSPKEPHKGKSDDSKALEFALEVINNRGTSPRSHKNMLVFAAADQSLCRSMADEAKRYLAWESIRADREALNLDASQTRETDQNIKHCDTTLNSRIEEAYSWMLAPHVDLASGSMDMEWEAEHVSGRGEGVAKKVASKLLSNEAAIDRWAPALLRMELDRVLWKDADHIQIKKLWDYLTMYAYLPRLAGYGVLENAILQGLNSDEHFGIAAGVADDRYLELSLGDGRAYVNMSDYLVRPDKARVQLECEAAEKVERERKMREEAEAGNDTEETKVIGGGNESSSNSGNTGEGAQPKSSGSNVTSKPSLPKSFKMSADIDPVRVSKDIQTIVSEIVSQIQSVDGTQIDLTFEVNAYANEGLPQQLQRTLSENCKTMKIADFRFD